MTKGAGRYRVRIERGVAGRAALAVGFGRFDFGQEGEESGKAAES